MSRRKLESAASVSEKCVGNFLWGIFLWGVLFWTIRHGFEMISKKVVRRLVIFLCFLLTSDEDRALRYADSSFILFSFLGSSVLQDRHPYVET